jgi:hypothetical protein
MSGNHRELVLLSILAFCWAIASRVESDAPIPAGWNQPQMARTLPAPRPVAGTSLPRAVPPAPLPYRTYTSPAVQPAVSGAAGEVGRQAQSVALNTLIAARR